VCSKASCQPLPPIARTAVAVHNGHDPDPVRLIHVNHPVGEGVSQMPAGRRIKQPKTARVPADVVNQPLDFVVEATAQFRLDGGVVARGLSVFLRRPRMKGMWLYRPTIWRIWAETVSLGTRGT
jgi:hypothetical protein